MTAWAIIAICGTVSLVSLLVYLDRRLVLAVRVAEAMRLGENAFLEARNAKNAAQIASDLADRMGTLESKINMR